MKNLFTCILMAGSSLLFGSTATLTKTATKSLANTPWNATLSIDKFNSTLGVLDSIDITLKCSISNRLRIENEDATSSTYSGTLSGECKNLTYSLTVTTSQAISGTLGPADGILDYAGTSGFNSGFLTQTGSAGTGLLTDATNLALFSGTGTVDFLVSSLGTSTVTSTGNVTQSITTQADAELTVVYNYTAPAAPSVAKAFAVSTTEINKDVAMTITITNGNISPSITLNGISISDTPPSGMVFNQAILPTTTCTSGTVVFNAGTLQLTGATLSGGASCTVSASVQLTSAGTYLNTTSTVCADNSNCGGTASDDIVATNPPPPPPPPGGNQGCTPGFWLNTNTINWVNATPNQLVTTYFNVPGAYGLSSLTMIGALKSSGNSRTVPEAAQFLLRSAVAGLLNIYNPNVAYPAEVGSFQTSVNAALASGNRDAMVSLMTKIDADNNLGCPLSSSKKQ